jgi:hypothetical protein
LSGMNLTSITMNNEELKCLLAKFYDGETTEEEEKYLRALFSADLVPEGFETEKDYILFCLANGHMEEPSPMLEENILKAIDDSERLTVRPKTNKFLLLTISSAAAVILILLGTYFFIESRSAFRDTYSDPEIAYAETMKILFDVSSRLNKGARTLQPVSKLSEITNLSLEKLNESSILINKSIMKLNKLEKVAVDKRISDTGIIVK